MKFIVTSIAVIFTLVSFLIFVLTPIPGGVILFVASLVFLICSSEWAAKCLTALRLRLPVFNRSMVWLENKAGDRLGRVLRTTRPDH